MNPRCATWGSLAKVAVLLGIVLLVVAACAPAAPPTPTPIKAQPTPVATPTAAPKVEATKPAAPAATPTPAPAAKPTGKPIKIGYIAPLTGPVGQWGLRQRIAAQLAVEDVNRAGGINGSPLELTEGDDQANPRETVTLVRKMALEDKVLAIVGPLVGGACDVAGPLAVEIQFPLLTATCNMPGLTDKNRPWLFRFAPLDAASVPAAIEGFKKLYPQVRRMVIIGDTKWLTGQILVRELYPSALKAAGLEVLDTVPFETGITDFAAIVTRVKGLSPDGLAFGAQTAETLGLAKELARQQVKVSVVAPIATASGPEITLGAGALEGWVAPVTFDEDTQDPAGASVRDRFVKLAEAQPGAVKPVFLGSWAQAYDAVMALAQVMRDKKVAPDMELQVARTAIKDGLQGLKDYQGITSKLSMAPNGDINFVAFPVVAKGERWVRIK